MCLQLYCMGGHLYFCWILLLHSSCGWFFFWNFTLNPNFNEIGESVTLLLKKFYIIFCYAVPSKLVFELWNSVNPWKYNYLARLRWFSYSKLSKVEGYEVGCPENGHDQKETVFGEHTNRHTMTAYSPSKTGNPNRYTTEVKGYSQFRLSE